MSTQPQDWLGLGGKICVITGAGGGIGTAMATGFAAVGAQVVLLDRSAELRAVAAAEVVRLRPLTASPSLACFTSR